LKPTDYLTCNTFIRAYAYRQNDFDKGRSDEPIISKIQKFLESNKDKAFTEEEIIGHLYPDHIAWPGDTIALSSAVLILAYGEKIELRYINTSSGTKPYFRAKS
jgi:hypothetical protein